LQLSIAKYGTTNIAIPHEMPKNKNIAILKKYCSKYCSRRTCNTARLSSLDMHAANTLWMRNVHRLSI